MGVKRLKIKDELHYRPGRTGHHCSACNHFVPGEEKIEGILYGDPRCRLIGLNPGRQFRINPGYICDRYDNSKLLQRLRMY